VSTIIFPTDTADIIDQIRGVIGRDVTFVIPISSFICPTCGLDPVTGNALDSFCTTCSGEGEITVYSGVTVSGHVTWGYSELPNWQTGGTLDAGECRVQIKYTVINEDAVARAKSVLVDGREMQITKRILRGVQGINRILVDLIERDNLNE
jgi:hypothetical protein